MSWHLLAHACEVARHGDYVLLPWFSNDEVVLTNVEGRIHAFSNRCPHRGARIFTELRGNRPPVCGYHGRCAQMGQVRQYAVAASGGFIFVSRSQVGYPDPGEMITGFLEAAGPALTLHSTLRFTMDCDWRVAIDNALDLEHVEHVHAESLAKLRLTSVELVGYPDGSSIEAFRSAEHRLANLARVLGRPALFDYIHAHVFPRACVSSTGGWTYSLQNYFSRADGRTEFLHRLYVAEDVPGWFADKAATLNERVFREDAAICAGIPHDFKANLGPRDNRIRHFRSHA